MTTSTISNDDDIMDLVNQWNNTSSSNEKFYLSEQIDTKLNYILNNSGHVETILFFYKGGGMYTYKNEPIASEESIKNMDWYREALKNKGKVIVHGTLKSFTYNSMQQYVISASYSPYHSGNKEIEAIYFAFKVDNLDSFYSGIKIAKKGHMLIVDDKNVVLASGDNSIIGKSIKDIGFENNEIVNGISDIKGEKALVSSVLIPKTKWKVVNITKYDELTQGVREASRIVAIIIVLLITLFLIFSILFFREIIVPINNLSKKMKNVEKGNFDEAIEIKRDDELYQLGESFNKMVRQIKVLILQRDLKERQRHQAEIEALQSQINPHFLSNTLNSIRLMAMIAKADSIKNMTDSLIKLLQASFGKKGKLITVDEEIENLDSYLYIMKVRYGDRFDTFIDVTDEIREHYMLRLILQPVVENSILHGVSELEDKGEIRVRGFRQQNKIVFEVFDNGAGMSQEKLERLLTQEDSNEKGFSRIGIRNVDQRIKLNYGNEYGLKAESVLGEYTRITIELPDLIKKEGEFTYV
jgi:two-component system sensor histidine kinase YesM